MTKALKTLFAILVGCSVLIGCDQWTARHLGGTQTIELAENIRLVNITWKKDGSLWILTKTDSSQPPQTYEFKESSLLGVLEGTVRIVEK